MIIYEKEQKLKEQIMNFQNGIKEIERKIGYTFKDKSLLRQAFTRTSYCNEHKDRHGEKLQSNEVLEFFGDSLLSAAIATLLIKNKAERYEFGITTALDEGDFSSVKSKLSDKKNLSEAILSLGIANHLLMGEGDEKLGIDKEPSVMEDLFESIIGAIYIDSDFNIGEVVRVVEKLLDFNEYLKCNTPPIQSYKNALQEWCADKKHRRPAPVYKTVSESGPDHKKTYERACCIGDKVYGVGVGKNQKLADTAAAEAALRALIEEEKEDQEKKAKETASQSIQRLREISVREKKPSPEFRDLGESARSTSTKKEYEVECRFMGLSKVGRGPDKRSAKAEAADAVLHEIEAPKEEAKKAQKQKGAPKKTAPVLKENQKKTAPVLNETEKKAKADLKSKPSASISKAKKKNATQNPEAKRKPLPSPKKKAAKKNTKG